MWKCRHELGALARCRHPQCCLSALGPLLKRADLTAAAPPPADCARCDQTQSEIPDFTTPQHHYWGTKWRGTFLCKCEITDLNKQINLDITIWFSVYYYYCCHFTSIYPTQCMSHPKNSVLLLFGFPPQISPIGLTGISL